MICRPTMDPITASPVQRRGEIWTLAAGGEYGRKPRPALVVQSDVFQRIMSVVVCPLTSFQANAQTRIELQPAPQNGLRERSYIMVDKILTVSRSRLGTRMGTISEEEMHRLDDALALLLDLATGPAPPR